MSKNENRAGFKKRDLVGKVIAVVVAVVIVCYMFFNVRLFVRFIKLTAADDTAQENVVTGVDDLAP